MMCIFKKKAKLEVRPTSGMATIAKGLGVTITATGPKGGVVSGVGDGSAWLPYSGTVVYKKAGTYRIKILDKQGRSLVSKTVSVGAEAPTLHPPFVAGCPQPLEGVIVDCNKQVHGCGGAQRQYGAWPKPNEELSYHVAVTVDGLKVWGEEAKAKWYVGVEEPPPIPADMPVLTPQGTWYPGDRPGKPQPSCGLEIKKAVIEVKVENQIGGVAEGVWEIPMGGSQAEENYPKPCR